MPAIAKQHIIARGNDGTVYSKDLECYVDSKGKFRISIPEELAEEAMRQPPKPSDYGHRNICLAGKRGPGSVIWCAQLADGLSFLKAAAKRHISAEVAVERVIGISYTAVAAFYIMPDGTLRPNGVGADGDGDWWKPAGPGGKSPDNLCRRYTLGFAAQVLDRTTYKRASGDKTEWELAQNDTDASLTRLNSFAKINVLLCGDDWHTSGTAGPQMVIPYTPEMADRLADLMLGLCRMIGQVDAFFADAGALPAKLLSAGPPLLPTTTTNATTPQNA